MPGHDDDEPVKPGVVQLLQSKRERIERLRARYDAINDASPADEAAGEDIFAEAAAAPAPSTSYGENSGMVDIRRLQELTRTRVEQAAADRAAAAAELAAAAAVARREEEERAARERIEAEEAQRREAEIAEVARLEAAELAARERRMHDLRVRIEAERLARIRQRQLHAAYVLQLQAEARERRVSNGVALALLGGVMSVIAGFAVVGWMDARRSIDAIQQESESDHAQAGGDGVADSPWMAIVYLFVPRRVAGASHGAR